MFKLKMKRLRSIGILASLLIIVFVASACNRTANDPEQEQIPPKQVEVQTIATQDNIQKNLTASGTIVPKQLTSVRSLTQGNLQYIAPVGTQVRNGELLFRISDSNIETSYFNALQNLQQTEAITKQRIAQAELAVNGAEARLRASQNNYQSVQKQVDQSISSTKDSAVLVYKSSYNTSQQALDYLSTGALSNQKFRYQGLVSTDVSLRDATAFKFTLAVENFLNLKNDTSVETIASDLSTLNIVLNHVKNLLDSTAVLLDSAVSQTSEIDSVETVVSGYQTQINTHINSVLTSLSSIANAQINAEITLDQAQNQIELSQIDVDNAKVALENAKESVELEITIARNQIDNAGYAYSNLSVESPFAGTVLEVFSESGTQVSPGQEVLTLGNISIIEIEVGVEADFAQHLKIGDSVKIAKTYDGKISQIKPAGDLQSGKVGVTVQLAGASTELIAGEIADVDFSITFTEENLIVIPISAATIESTQTYVYVVKDGMVEKRDVVLGKLFDDQVSVTSGLNVGDQVVVSRSVFVSPGETVEIKN